MPTRSFVQPLFLLSVSCAVRVLGPRWAAAQPQKLAGIGDSISQGFAD